MMTPGLWYKLTNHQPIMTIYQLAPIYQLLPIHQLQNLPVTKSISYKIHQLPVPYTVGHCVFYIWCCKRSNQTRNLSFRHMYRVNVFKLDLPLTLTQMNLLNDIYQIEEWMRKGCYLYPYSMHLEPFRFHPKTLQRWKG